MDIFSKSDGPRKEDVRAKKLIGENAATIRKLADQISGGGYSQMRAEQKQRKEGPKAKGLIIHDLKAPAAADDPEPLVRISLNGRVVLMDAKTGRQLQLLGEVRGNFMSRHFKLATKENGFFTPLDDKYVEVIGHLNDIEFNAEFTEDSLAEAISKALGLNVNE